MKSEKMNTLQKSSLENFKFDTEKADSTRSLSQLHVFSCQLGQTDSTINILFGQKIAQS